ncbi:MAG: tyrosine-type recombinase/integrase [Oscillospiraceae bacterium]|nr:tyrosine-type recombinase/integrase [Oscillospiraceae bacterium]
MHPHSLRHHFGSKVMAKTNDVTLLADLLGHSSINTTAIYTRMSND